MRRSWSELGLLVQKDAVMRDSAMARVTGFLVLISQCRGSGWLWWFDEVGRMSEVDDVVSCLVCTSLPRYVGCAGECASGG